MIVPKKGRRSLYYRCVGSQGTLPPRPTSLTWITIGVLKPEITLSVVTWLEASNHYFTRYRPARPLWQLLIGRESCSIYSSPGRHEVGRTTLPSCSEEFWGLSILDNLIARGRHQSWSLQSHITFLLAPCEFAGA
jgi:hypothetical protein